MSEKPQPKKEVAIEEVFKASRNIWFYSTPDAIADFKEFGSIFQFVLTGRDRYQLTVDSRYDFDEVVKYIREY